MSGTGHLSVQQGKRVMVHMRNGQKFIGKFKERKATYVTLQLDAQSDMAIPTHDIRTISIYKEAQR